MTQDEYQELSCPLCGRINRDDNLIMTKQGLLKWGGCESCFLKQMIELEKNPVEIELKHSLGELLLNSKRNKNINLRILKCNPT